MAKADKTGIYTLNGARYRINAGDVLPEGAEMVTDEPAARSKGPAPENRAERSPETRKSAKKSDS